MGAIALSCSVAVAMSDTLSSEIGVMDSRTRSIVSLGCTTGATGNVPDWDAEFSRWIRHTRDRSPGPDGR